MKRMIAMLFASLLGCNLFASLSDGLVAYYPFDGNADDASGYENNGTTNGVYAVPDRNGKENGALAFDGDDWIRVASSDSLNTVTNIYTMSFWMNATDWNNGAMHIIGKDYQYSCAFIKENRAIDGQPYYLGGGDSEDDFPLGFSVPLGTWHHWTVTSDGNTILVYMDGEVKTTFEGTGNVRVRSNPMYIGRTGDYAGFSARSYFEGTLDELRIYNRALSASEVAELYNGETQTWQVTFDANGGLIDGCETSSSVDVENGAEIGWLPEAERTGYSLLGWFTEISGGIQIDENIVITSNATYYAHWALRLTGNVIETIEENYAFEYTGSAQSPLLDGDILHLPFGFPWGGRTYYEIDLASFGCVNFADGYIWVADGMDSEGRCVFVAQSEHSVTIRWGDDGTGTAQGVANASITLYDNGSFALNYGENDGELGQGFDFYHDDLDWYGTSIYWTVPNNKRVLIDVEWTGTPSEIVDDVCWFFKPREDLNGVEIIGTAGDVPSNIIVPQTLAGSNVVAIADYAFYYASQGWGGTTNVVLNEGLTYLGHGAFEGCSNLKSISIPSSLKTITGFAFADCHALAAVNIAEGVCALNECCFAGCSLLSDIILPSTITNIERAIFQDCNSLTNVVLNCAKPSLLWYGEPYNEDDDSNNILWHVPVATTKFYVRNACGWKDDSGNRLDTWFGRTIIYDPIPSIGDEPTAEDISEALDGSTDERLTVHITGKNAYKTYREWVNRVCGSDITKRQAVKDSIHTWLSFALDVNALIVNAPKQGDLKIDTFKRSATSGAFDFEISVEDIAIGEGATSANLAEIFSIEGANTPNGDYSTNDVELTFGTPEDGKVRCTARAKDTTKTSFFMRVKMNP